MYYVEHVCADDTCITLHMLKYSRDLNMLKIIAYLHHGNDNNVDGVICIKKQALLLWKYPDKLAYNRVHS